MADPLARPYPRYTSGTGIAFDYDPVTHGLVYTYSTAETAGAPTVIALPRRHYPVEPQVSVSFGDWEYRAQQAELWVFDRLCERAADAGEQQVVSVSP